ncbi:MAG: hypothetical protein RIT81_19030 [Deltaproteobacteria bacterium]
MTAKTVDVTVVPESIEVEVGSAPTKVAFSVTYQHDEPLEALVKVLGSDGSVESWVELEGARERTFTKDSTTQILANVSVPSSAASGEYSFKLAFVGVRNPDEDYTESPSVRVKARQPAERPSKPFPIWILALVAVLVIVIGVVIFFVVRDTRAGIRESCAEGVQCADGLTCSDKQICLFANGGTCADGNDCLTGYCGAEDHVCADEPGPPGLGEACESECAEGLTCAGKKCLGTLGFACTSSEDCHEMVCDNSQCSRLGQKCSNDASCGEARLMCSSLGAERRCLLKEGQPCHELGAALCDSQQCSGDKCVAPTRCRNNTHCESDESCVSGFCYTKPNSNCSGNDVCLRFMCVEGKCPSYKCSASRKCPVTYGCSSTGRCVRRRAVKTDLLERLKLKNWKGSF